MFHQSKLAISQMANKISDFRWNDRVPTNIQILLSGPWCNMDHQKSIIFLSMNANIQVGVEFCFISISIFTFIDRDTTKLFFFKTRSVFLPGPLPYFCISHRSIKLTIWFQFYIQPYFYTKITNDPSIHYAVCVNLSCFIFCHFCCFRLGYESNITINTTILNSRVQIKMFAWDLFYSIKREGVVSSINYLNNICGFGFLYLML